ncbi:hypothetical protein Tco_1363981 [Tanacetum coccineum]
MKREKSVLLFTVFYLFTQGQIKGEIPIEGQKGQFRQQSTHGQNNTSSNAPYWLIPTRNATLARKKAQGKGYFALILLSKEAQVVSITDCHAGNPCELSYDPRAKIKAPIIGRMDGRD